MECPYCLKQCDSRGNRDKHVAVCKKQRDTGKKAKHGQQSLKGFFQPCAAPAASSMQLHASTNAGPPPSPPAAPAAPPAPPPPLTAPPAPSPPLAAEGWGSGWEPDIPAAKQCHGDAV